MFAQANQPQGGYGQPAQSLPSLAQVMAGGTPLFLPTRRSHRHHRHRHGRKHRGAAAARHGHAGAEILRQRPAHDAGRHPHRHHAEGSGHPRRRRRESRVRQRQEPQYAASGVPHRRTGLPARRRRVHRHLHRQRRSQETRLEPAQTLQLRDHPQPDTGQPSHEHGDGTHAAPAIAAGGNSRSACHRFKRWPPPAIPPNRSQAC